MAPKEVEVEVETELEMETKVMMRTLVWCALSVAPSRCRRRRTWVLVSVNASCARGLRVVPDASPILILHTLEAAWRMRTAGREMRSV